MSLKINQIVLHQLVKLGEQYIDIVLRDSVLPISESTTTMMNELNQVYHLKNKAYGQFTLESEFAKLVKQYQSKTLSFLDFTQKTMVNLRDEIVKYTFAAGGIVVFCHYQFLAVEYLLIAIIDSRDSTRVDEMLNINTIHYLDISHTDIAARLSLTEWQIATESPRYLTFLKGRVGRKIADFFLDYLSVDVCSDTKTQNKILLQAIDDYCTTSELDKNEKQLCCEQVFSYCRDQIKQGEEIALTEIANVLPVDDNKNFRQFVKENHYELADQFPADCSTLKQLTKFSGSGRGITIGFDAALLGERIFWDEATDTLTIKGTPPNLRDQLKRKNQQNN